MNLAEVLTKLNDWGAAKDARVEARFALLERVEPFTFAQSVQAAAIRPQTRHAGLSLGDRACLALALKLDAEVYTADPAWAGVHVGCNIHLVR